MRLEFFINSRTTSRAKRSSTTPPLARDFNVSTTSVKPSATAAFSKVIGSETLAELPTARNSNLFPVNANGEVRLRSV